MTALKLRIEPVTLHTPPDQSTRRTFIAGAAACLMVPTPSLARTTNIATVIAALTNDIRADRSIGRLRPSTRLGHASSSYAQTLARYNRLSHTVDGTDLAERASAVNYRFRALGENIGWTARGRTDAEIARDLVERWMDSRGHRRNILNRRYREFGVGISVRGQKTYAVQLFGTKG